MNNRFTDRREAGQQLAADLGEYADRDDVVVLGLPRGGVPVANEVARALNAPLDVVVVRKLGVPGHEELAMGAIASNDVRLLHDDLVERAGITEQEIQRVEAGERAELERREAAYRSGREPVSVEGKTVLLVDDGIATGASMRAAVRSVRSQNPARIVVAVPAASPRTCDAFRQLVDDVVCTITPEPFRAVGLWYQHFPQTTDAQVEDLLSPRAPAE
ncbi:MAG: phosphoribosyltransferase [Chloroflexi bacterium]|nr:phosphoribosyltransferase [Chloroflexota bacterium]